MSCNRPILMKTEDGRIKEVPCRVCNGCRRAELTKWTRRIQWEVQKYKKEYNLDSSFITLTYNDLNVPLDMNLNKKDLSDFKKRVRKEYEKLDIKLKFVSCGEYGDQTQRPHYHMIAIGIPYGQKYQITKIWGKGQIDIKPASRNNIQYVLKYITKGVRGEEKKKYYEEMGKEPPFISYSHGIGEDYMRKNIKDIERYGGIKDGVNTQYIGIYWKHKLGITGIQSKQSPEFKTMIRNQEITMQKLGYDENFKKKANEIAGIVMEQQSGQKAVYNAITGDIDRPEKLTKEEKLKEYKEKYGYELKK